jgi:phosphate transport system substrate-binding protein
MRNLPWGDILAIVGIAVPILAFLWEFTIVGRKRLGYRVQMDTDITTVDGGKESSDPDVLAQLHGPDGAPLQGPSLVLVRIENNGTTHIDPNDYSSEGYGIQIEFPGRRVAAARATELSDFALRSSFSDDLVLATDARAADTEWPIGIVSLPKVPLNRDDHYKVLALLEQAASPGLMTPPARTTPLIRGLSKIPLLRRLVIEDRETTTRRVAKPEIVAAIKGGFVHETKSRTGMSLWSRGLVLFLVLVIGALFFVIRSVAVPLDCASGNLTVVGSTAFEPVVAEAARMYHNTCPGANFDLRFGGSVKGVETLNAEGQKSSSGSPAMLAFSDGAKAGQFPRLLPRPVAFSLFTLVINKDAGVEDLSSEQVKRLYDGRIANWKDIGGLDVPVRLVERSADSGTRTAFEQRVLGKVPGFGRNSNDCTTPLPNTAPGVVRCERSSTTEALDTVADVPGAIGYSELGAAAGRNDVVVLRIDGYPATLDGVIHGAYHYWETEYAYTYGEPAADTLAAGFLRYLTELAGKDVVRAHGHRPCSELANPVLCRPS